MCGRFAQAQTPHEISERFGARESAEIASLFDDAGGHYNIAPTQLVLAVTVAEDGVRELTPLKWGLVPPWAKDPKDGAKCCNARSETVAEKPSFREAFKQRRCIIPGSALLAPSAPAVALQELLQPCASVLLRVYPVRKGGGQPPEPRSRT